MSISFIEHHLPDPGLGGVFRVLDEPPPELGQLSSDESSTLGTEDHNHVELASDDAQLIAEDLPEPGLGAVFVLWDAIEEGVRVLHQRR